jgi:hypothetical protein
LNYNSKNILIKKDFEDIYEIIKNKYTNIKAN